MIDLVPKKPNLACDAPEEMHFPVFASPKLDGIRDTVWNGTPLTRTLKDVPNRHIRETIQAAKLPAVFDGELIVGLPTDKNCYRNTVSGVMSRDGTPSFTMYVFDYVPVQDMRVPFRERTARIANATSSMQAFHPWFKVLEQAFIYNAHDLALFEEKQLLLGYEGLIVCNPDAVYKHGRSTASEQGKMKVKRFVDAEAMVVGYTELMHNANEATIDATGHTKRSTHKANQIPMGVLGALMCVTPEGVPFNIGMGFTDEERANLWAYRDTLAGRIAKYKCFPIGVKIAPRHPVFLGWRSALDM